MYLIVTQLEKITVKASESSKMREKQMLDR